MVSTKNETNEKKKNGEKNYYAKRSLNIKVYFSYIPPSEWLQIRKNQRKSTCSWWNSVSRSRWKKSKENVDTYISPKRSNQSFCSLKSEHRWIISEIVCWKVILMKKTNKTNFEWIIEYILYSFTLWYQVCKCECACQCSSVLDS